jgi:hypothetical protein
MIVPKLEFAEIVRGRVGATTHRLERQVGETCWVRDSPRNQPLLARVVDVWPVEDGYELLLERADELSKRRAPERPRLRLTRAQRAKLFAGESPYIGGQGEAPVGKGEEVRLSSRVSIRVLRVDPERGGGWKLHYELTDTRDPVRLLRRTPPAHREGDELDITDQGAIREAARQSFYTADASAAVTDAGEAPDREWVAMRTKTQREFDHQRRLAKHAEKLRDRSKQKTRRKKAA